MGAIDGISLSLTAAELLFEQSDARAREAVAKLDAGSGATALINSLRISASQNELVAVGVFSIFEARMRDKVEGRSFFKGLQEMLLKEELFELANKFRLYYLAVNVLKHGAGSSHNELLKVLDLPFAVRATTTEFFMEGDVSEPDGLIDVEDFGFLNGLLEVISSVHTFLIECKPDV
jgi:hypothetical protein